MSLEIERRFLVQGDEWKSFTKNSQELKQGYLISNKDGWTIRARIVDNQESWITLKYPQEGITRYEFEYKIPLSDAEELLEIAEYKLTKTRYELIFENRSWIVDCFKEENFPLVIAEIELNSANEILKQPSWCNQEISNFKEWSNAALAKLPISQRPMEKRHIFL